jgi:uncharacterized protein
MREKKESSVYPPEPRNMVQYSHTLRRMVNAAAALILYRNKFLFAKRAKGEYTDKWEFPKSDIGEQETAFQALKRVVKHHFGIDIFPYLSIKRFSYQTTQKKGELVLIQCSILSSWQDTALMSSTYADFLWTSILNTETLDFAPVDKKIVSFLRFDTTVLPHKTRGPGFASMDTENQETRALRTKNRGFASMKKTKRQLIASMGGKAAHAKGRAHCYTSEEAKLAGRIGGRGRQRKYTQPLALLVDPKIAEIYTKYTENKVTIAEICREYQISRTMLYRYFQQYTKNRPGEE